MTDKLFKTLIRHIFTVRDMHHILLLLREYFESSLFTQNRQPSNETFIQQFLKKHGEDRYIIDTMVLLGEEFYKSFTTDNIEDLLNELEKKVDTIPTIKLTTPISLPYSEIPRLGKWLRKNIHEDIIVDLDVGHDALGGCFLEWNSIYHDFSLKYFLDKNRDEVRNTLTSYGKK